MDSLHSFKLPRQDWKRHCPQIELNALGTLLPLPLPLLTRPGDGQKKTAANILSFANVTLADIHRTVRAVSPAPSEGSEEESLLEISSQIADTVEANCKYYLYLSRQETEISRFRSEGGMPIPRDVDYTQAAFPALSGEELEKLRLHRPETLHHASLIEGMTSAGLVYLHHFVKRTHAGGVGGVSAGEGRDQVLEQSQQRGERGSLAGRGDAVG
jgi:hypothetical protein